MENEIKDLIKNAVKFFKDQEYMGEPTTLDEAIEIVRDIVNDTLEEIDE